MDQQGVQKGQQRIDRITRWPPIAVLDILAALKDGDSYGAQAAIA